MKAKYDVYQLLDAKKKGLELTRPQIKWFIDQYTQGLIQDYHVSAFLMAAFINGLNSEETASLTDAMLESGAQLKFKGQNVIDKHSTGGIGDKASFILAPIAAAAGVKVPMIAGRGLGHTGGTVDKVEAIRGFKTDLNLTQFSELLNKNGVVLIGQTPEIAPADRLIYALRDVTATIDSIPLITASIMSKKLAEGANGIVFDIKVGSGAFMKTKSDAKKLALSLMQTAKRFKKGSAALLTDMDQPLGHFVGHSHELIESIETLKGQGPKDLALLSIELAAHMIFLAKKAKTLDLARDKAISTITDGSALKKFRELIDAQGGDSKVIDNYSLLPQAKAKTVVRAPKSGYLESFQNEKIGHLLIDLGGGRRTKTDKIDFAVAFEFHRKKGDQLKKGDALLTIHHHPEQKNVADRISKEMVTEVIKLSSKKIKPSQLIIETIA